MCQVRGQGLDKWMTLTSLHKPVNNDYYPTEAREAKRLTTATRLISGKEKMQAQIEPLAFPAPPHHLPRRTGLS